GAAAAPLVQESPLALRRLEFLAQREGRVAHLGAALFEVAMALDERSDERRQPARVDVLRRLVEPGIFAPARPLWPLLGAQLLDPGFRQLGVGEEGIELGSAQRIAAPPGATAIAAS